MNGPLRSDYKFERGVRIIEERPRGYVPIDSSLHNGWGICSFNRNEIVFDHYVDMGSRYGPAYTLHLDGRIGEVFLPGKENRLLVPDFCLARRLVPTALGPHCSKLYIVFEHRGDPPEMVGSATLCFAGEEDSRVGSHAVRKIHIVVLRLNQDMDRETL